MTSVSLSSGYRIGPFEVERAVDSHAAVLECAMIPCPDLLRGEIEFAKELPKTISGKIKRKALRTLEFERKRAVIETNA
jgi:acetyl-CoA synthetase